MSDTDTLPEYYDNLDYGTMGNLAQVGWRFRVGGVFHGATYTVERDAIPAVMDDMREKVQKLYEGMLHERQAPH